MEILVYRKWPKDEYTIGRIFIDGVLCGNTLEDCDRGLSDAMDENTIRNRKVYGKTAIPRGRYIVDMRTYSPKFAKYPFYKEVCNGMLPRLKNVKGFEGILIHCGVDHNNTEGCILVGSNTLRGKLTDSKEIFKKIYAMMKAAHDRGEVIYITIE